MPPTRFTHYNELSGLIYRLVTVSRTALINRKAGSQIKEFGKLYVVKHKCIT